MVISFSRGCVVVVGGVLAAAACRPSIEGRPSLIDEPRVLALRSTPAEAAPDEPVTYESLYAMAPGVVVDEGELEWATCTLRKPLSAAGAINPQCLMGDGDGIVSLGSGGETTGVILGDACRLFGPTPPDPEPGEPALRAADPDTTGGYYQPVTVRYQRDEGAEYVVGVTRLFCGIGAATQEQVVEYNQRYRRNENPSLDDVVIVKGGERHSVLLSDSDLVPVQVPVGQVVSLEAVWPKCPVEDSCGDAVCGIDESAETCKEDCEMVRGCSGAETYLVFDPDARDLATRHEQMRVSWYATGGEFAHDRTAANVSGAEPASQNDWKAPDEEGTVSFWVVLRDDRRGVGFRQFEVAITR
jgi:hypothetical protein